MARPSQAVRLPCTLRPQIFRHAVNQLRKHEPANKALGGFWHPTGFRGYQLESWEQAVKGSERRVRSSYLEVREQAALVLPWNRGQELPWAGSPHAQAAPLRRAGRRPPGACR